MLFEYEIIDVYILQVTTFCFLPCQPMLRKCHGMIVANYAFRKKKRVSVLTNSL